MPYMNNRRPLNCTNSGKHSLHVVTTSVYYSRADARFAHSQWETALLCNSVENISGPKPWDKNPNIENLFSYIFPSFAFPSFQAFIQHAIYPIYFIYDTAIKNMISIMVRAGMTIIIKMVIKLMWRRVTKFWRMQFFYGQEFMYKMLWSLHIEDA